MNSAITLFFSAMMLFSSGTAPAPTPAPTPVSEQEEMYTSKHSDMVDYIDVDEISQEVLQQSYGYYLRIASMDEQETMMSKRFKKDFLDFRTHLNAQNNSEKLLAVLLTQLYFEKLALEENGRANEEQEAFQRTSAQLDNIFEE